MQTIAFGPAQLHVERFERVERLLRVPAGSAALRLVAHTPTELPRGVWPSLIVNHGSAKHEFEPLPDYGACVPMGAHDEWTLGSMFAAPVELADEPGAVFALRLHGGAMLALPAPSPALIARQQRDRGLAPRHPWPYVVRRIPPLVVATCQALMLASAFTAGAVADGTTTTATSGVTQVADTGTTGPTGATGPTGPQGSAGDQSSQPPAAGSGPTPPPVSPPDGGGGQQHSPPGGDAGQQGSSAPAAGHPQQAGSTPGSPVAANPPAPAKVGPTVGSPGGAAPRPHGKGNRRGGDSTRTHKSESRHGGRRAPGTIVPGTAAGTLAPLGTPLDLTGLLPNPSWLTSGPSGVALVANRPPSFLVPIYEAAGQRYSVPWRVLAAINALETDYGDNVSVSSAGAMGWMQFMPATWRRWAVDASGNARANPYNPRDAIFTAARYLRASEYRGRYGGRPRYSLRHAIYVYNHAHWYVEAVLLGAQLLGGGGNATDARVQSGLALPLDPWYMNAIGRTDDGVDIETAPEGALVYSMTTGIVSAVGNNPGGFGPNYPVVKTTAGPLKDHCVYYGHVAKALVKPGQKVGAGQPIAIIGATGDAASLGHGHIEVGFSDAGGNPLSHHGAVAWTTAGQFMRTVIVSVSSRFGIRNS